MRALPDYCATGRLPAAHGGGPLTPAADLDPQNDNGLFYRNGDTDYYLLYRPEIHWLRSNEADPQRAAGPAHPRHRAGKRVVFAADKFMSQRFLEPIWASPSARSPTNCIGTGLGGRTMELKEYQIRVPLTPSIRWRHAPWTAAQERIDATAVAALERESGVTCP